LTALSLAPHAIVLLKISPQVQCASPNSLSVYQLRSPSPLSPLVCVYTFCPYPNVPGLWTLSTCAVGDPTFDCTPDASPPQNLPTIFHIPDSFSFSAFLLDRFLLPSDYNFPPRRSFTSINRLFCPTPNRFRHCLQFRDDVLFLSASYRIPASPELGSTDPALPPLPLMPVLQSSPEQPPVGTFSFNPEELLSSLIPVSLFLISEDLEHLHLAISLSRASLSTFNLGLHSSCVLNATIIL